MADSSDRYGGAFLNYKADVWDALVSRGAFVSADWLREQMPRLLAAYDLGEPVATIADTLALFALHGGRREKTPRELAVRVVSASETVQLLDGPAEQALVPGVAPVPLTARQIAAESQRRDQRRGHAQLPAGSLWDDTAHRQQSLF